MSWADAFQIGVEKGLQLTGGPQVALGRGRDDSPIPDDVDELPGLEEFGKLKTRFSKKGFSVREMVVSILGGHSLGRFFGINFTPHPNKFDNLYAVNLLHFLRKGKDSVGFTSLSSDRELLKDKEALMWVKFYADRTLTKRGRVVGIERLGRDFRRYLEKQGRMGMK